MTFSTYHPAVNFIYFTAVILFGMILMHPLFLGVALVSSFAYSILLSGKNAVRFNFLYMLPMLALMALLNPLFNREGETVLFLLFQDLAITLESLLYGAAAAMMFISIICWFSCFNVIVTSDKLQYLFSRFSPSLALLFSMTLRFIPRMKAQIKAISAAQRCIGRDISNGNMLQRARHGLRILSILATWALENAVETADSMKSRGYGLPGRTIFSVYRLARRDRIVLALFTLCTSVVAACIVSGVTGFSFFPVIQAPPVTPLLSAGILCYTLLCTTPLIIEGMEALLWKRSASRI